jgi:hypothetical protein
MHRRELGRLIDKEAALKTELHKQETDEAKAKDAARRYQDQAGRASSSSSVNSALNAAKREIDKALQAGRKAADLTRKLADNARDQGSRRRSLEAAEKADRQAQEREAERRKQKEKKDRQSQDCDDARRRETEKAHAREVARLSAPQVHYVHIRPPEPEKLRVLYLTANPDLDLRTEEEVRQVQQALRGAKYRDFIAIEQKPAATFQDLLDGLNDVRPHVVHFSGHGGAQALLMDGGDVHGEAAQEVTFGLLIKALEATDSPPTLLVLNACDTLDGADVILPAVPVVVAMSKEVLDVAAIVFAQQFYAALASGQSVGSALKQAKVAIEAALIDDGASALPRCISRDDVVIDDLVLVRGFV